MENNHYNFLNCYNINKTNEEKVFHFRNSPFGQMVNPLFETGERIYNLASNNQTS